MKYDLYLYEEVNGIRTFFGRFDESIKAMAAGTAMVQFADSKWIGYQVNPRELDFSDLCEAIQAMEGYEDPLTAIFEVAEHAHGWDDIAVACEFYGIELSQEDKDQMERWMK